MLASRLSRIGVKLPLRIPVRYYTDPKKSIEDFNQSKTQYLFGHNFSSLDEINKKITPELDLTSSEIHQRIRSKLQQDTDDDINSFIEKDPRLAELTPGSAEYREKLFEIHQEFNQQQKQQRKKFEINERVKGMFLGIVFLVSIVAGHQIFMHYEYLKNSLLVDYVYKIEDGKVKALTDPAKNTKNLELQVRKLSEELDEKTLGNLVNSGSSTGLYVSGVQNGKKLPVRVKFFDGKLIRDVKIVNGQMAVVTSNGELYLVKGDVPTLVPLPFKVSKCEISSQNIYALNSKGEVVYVPRDFDQAATSRTWLGRSTVGYEKIAVGTPISDFSLGQHHMLMLSRGGALYVANTTVGSSDVSADNSPLDSGSRLQNYGQFGIPSLSPYEKGIKIPANQAFEMTLLNNEVVVAKNGDKSVRARKFISIASGKYHNIVADADGNVWAWGRNIYGECGLDISYQTDFQPVPKRVFGKDDFLSLCKSGLGNPKNLKRENFRVDKVYAGDETSYIQLNYTDEEHKHQNLLCSFGNGVKGQLGTSRFLHVCPKPAVIKSLVNLSEYDDVTQSVGTIDFKDISVGNNHIFVTLNTSGAYKDVVVFGDNEWGQFGNGKVAKSCKPINLPKLVEPEDVETDFKSKSPQNLVKQLNNVVTNRLQLSEGLKIHGKKVEQVIVAGENSSAIFYRSV